jgi:poly(A) polymerase
LDLLRDSHLLKEILPELAATIGCLQSPDYHPEGDVYNHIRLMLRHLPDEACPTLVWAVLLHDIAKPVTASADVNSGAIHFYSHDKIGAAMAAAIMERLRFPRKECEAVSACVLHHMQFMHVPQMRKATLRRLLMRPTFAVELELHRLDCLGSHQQLDIYELLKGQAEMLLQQPQIRPPLLTGDDLIVLGIKPGPYMGELLAEIRERQLQDELTTPAQARAWVRERMRDSH